MSAAGIPISKLLASAPSDWLDNNGSNLAERIPLHSNIPLYVRLLRRSRIRSMPNESSRCRGLKAALRADGALPRTRALQPFTKLATWKDGSWRYVKCRGEGAKEHSPISTHQQPPASDSVVQSDVSDYTRVATLFETRSISIRRYHDSNYALKKGLDSTWLAPSIPIVKN